MKKSELIAQVFLNFEKHRLFNIEETDEIKSIRKRLAKRYSELKRQTNFSKAKIQAYTEWLKEILDESSLGNWMNEPKNMVWDHSPPKHVLDDSGVRHVQEIILPARYKLEKCPCGIIHPLESETWFHKPLILTQDFKNIAVFRACKECGEILTQELDERSKS